MIIRLQSRISPQKIQDLIHLLASRGGQVKLVEDGRGKLLGLAGGQTWQDREILALEGVEEISALDLPYKLVSRELQKQDQTIRLGNILLGGDRFALGAGPPMAEDPAELPALARDIREAGAVFLYAGIYRHRTSPYDYAGPGPDALESLSRAARAEGLALVCEIAESEHLEAARDTLDGILIGPRNMQNHELLRRAAALGKPLFLKRGFGASLEEWLLAGEYLLQQGPVDLVFVESGIRSFERSGPLALDMAALGRIRRLSPYPVFCHPGPALGDRVLVRDVALAAAALGIQGLIVDCAPQPENRRFGAEQCLPPESLAALGADLKALCRMTGREFLTLPLGEGPAQTVGNVSSPTSSPAGAHQGPVIVYQGERGAFSEQASRKLFPGQEGGIRPLKQFRDVFDAVLEGRADFGVLPLENTLGGSVHDNYDLLIQYPDLHIVQETQIRIEHNLIVHPDADWKDIRQVLSHPQGLAQSAEFLSQYPWERVAFYDTAGSVAHIAQTGDKSKAAIAGREAARHYGMKVLKAGIETNPLNFTRFVVVAPLKTPAKGQPQRGALVFSTAHSPGALLQCLRVLADAGLNMKKLESRPVPGKPWSYRFYLELELSGHDRESFLAALEGLKDSAEELRVLGVYPVLGGN